MSRVVASSSFLPSLLSLYQLFASASQVALVSYVNVLKEIAPLLLLVNKLTH